ncbi:DNA-directed RNA polymerase subunit delta [Bombilactobacillus thymidiniphilus]|uniref:Probable DNA-directed RNA polymerase subunit delta n=2 Tax=Bombilactobacillus thymidiniphilus TaxID=2923363 RepID=A0ABY4PFN7_9LACO|nr:DNA-directed RNA polymerase subunit delta [Bombilactobacillus thymidiniphilus]UQS84336.1 DNA-directed RNA polymerase subunit delta [Bombilactobacillus thymidiniphilus]
MIEVAHAILEQKGSALSFADIVNAIQQFMDTSDSEIRERLPQFYTDLNSDGGFISLGENVWGLRTWYPYDSVDEEVNHPEDSDESHIPKIKRVNAFLDDEEDDDVIDYDDDTSSSSDDDDLSDDHVPDLSQFAQQDITFGNDDDDNLGSNNNLADGLEGDLSEFSADDDEE